jgi:hypothetical protein
VNRVSASFSYAFTHHLCSNHYIIPILTIPLILFLVISNWLQMLIMSLPNRLHLLSIPMLKLPFLVDITHCLGAESVQLVVPCHWTNPTSLRAHLYECRCWDSQGSLGLPFSPVDFRMDNSWVDLHPLGSELCSHHMTLLYHMKQVQKHWFGYPRVYPEK